MKNIIDTTLNGHRVLNLADNTSLEKAIVCLISSSASPTLSAINELIVERKKAGADPTPLDLGEERFTPFVFKKGEDLVDVSSSGYESDREGIYLTGSNDNGAYVINVRKTGDLDKDRRLVITGPGAFLAGQYWFPESVSEEDVCYTISQNLFVDTAGRVFFLDNYNPERYVIPLIQFMNNYDPGVTSATFFYEDDLDHGFNIKILFTTNPDGSRTGNVFSYTVTDLGKLEPVVKIHYGRFVGDMWKEDINLPQIPGDLRAFKDCLLRRNTNVEFSVHSNFEKVLLELLDILLSEDRSVDISEGNGSYKVKDSFTLIFHYFDQDSFPSEWVPLFNDKLKITSPVVTADRFRRWTGIDDIPYEVPLTVIPYRFGVYLMNKTDRGYLGPFENTEPVILSDLSDQYPSLKKVDLHNTVWLPARKVMVEINKKAIGKSRLCTLDMLDTRSNCSTGKEFPYETTLGEVEEGYTFYFSKPDGSEPRWAREEVVNINN